MTSHQPTSSLAFRFVWAFAAVCLSAISLTSCLNDDNLIGENCYDEILNNGEELVDCGGPICEPCDPCENGEWNPLLGEQWVDCGGSCAPGPGGGAIAPMMSRLVSASHTRPGAGGGAVTIRPLPAFAPSAAVRGCAMSPQHKPNSGGGCRDASSHGGGIRT